MIAALAFILSLFGFGFLLMVRELLKAPEAVEDESGFRIIRQPAHAVARTASHPQPAPRAAIWVARRA